MSTSIPPFMKRMINAGVVVGIFAALRYTMERDPIHHHPVAAWCQTKNEYFRNIHQHRRKIDLFNSASASVVHLNAGSGVSVPLMGVTTTQYLANEPNPILARELRSNLKNFGMSVSHVENTSALEMLNQLPDNSVDTVILDGSLRYEKAQAVKQIITESHRVMRPGARLLFSEDIRYNGQHAPLQWLRRAVRNFFFQERQTDFIIPLIKTFGSAHVEDWTVPANSRHHPRVGVRQLLLLDQAATISENITKYRSMLPAYSLSFLHREQVAGYCIKKTDQVDNLDVYRGFINTHDVANRWNSYSFAKSEQSQRDEFALQDGQAADEEIFKEMDLSFKRALHQKPTMPKSGGYVDSMPLTCNIFEAITE